MATQLRKLILALLFAFNLVFTGSAVATVSEHCIPSSDFYSPSDSCCDEVCEREGVPWEGYCRDIQGHGYCLDEEPDDTPDDTLTNQPTTGQVPVSGSIVTFFDCGDEEVPILCMATPVCEHGANRVCHMITAAHCLEFSRDGEACDFLGMNIQGTEPTPGGFLSITLHPDYDPDASLNTEISNDIAIISFPGGCPEGLAITPVSFEDDRSPLTEYYICNVDLDDNPTNCTMLSVDLPEWWDNTQLGLFCIGSGNDDLDVGDSGSAVFVQDPTTGQRVMVGCFTHEVRLSGGEEPLATSLAATSEFLSDNLPQSCQPEDSPTPSSTVSPTPSPTVSPTPSPSGSSTPIDPPSDP